MHENAASAILRLFQKALAGAVEVTVGKSDSDLFIANNGDGCALLVADDMGGLCHPFPSPALRFRDPSAPLFRFRPGRKPAMKPATMLAESNLGRAFATSPSDRATSRAFCSSARLPVAM